MSGGRDGSLNHLNSKPGPSTNSLAPALGKIQNQKSQQIQSWEHWWLRIASQNPKGWEEKLFLSQEKGRQQNTWDDLDLSRVLTTHKPSCQTRWKDLMLIMKLTPVVLWLPVSRRVQNPPSPTTLEKIKSEISCPEPNRLESQGALKRVTKLKKKYN